MNGKELNMATDDKTLERNLQPVPAFTTTPKPALPQTPIAPLAKGVDPLAIPVGAATIPSQIRPAAPQPTTPAQPLARQFTAPAPKPSVAQQSTAAYGTTPGARADIIYGATGSTKTSRLGDVAEYVWRKYRQRSRLVTADSGGYEAIEALVRTKDNPDGIIDVFALGQHRTNLYESMEKLTLGWWPENRDDPQSKLLPPSQNGLADVGAYLIEGLTSWCELMMRTNLTDLKNINVPRSDNEKSNLLSSGEFQHRFASQTDYGSIQQIIAEFVRNTGMLPVRKVVWTALEQRGEDDQKKPVYGPDIIGKKATGQCGPWFGNFLHLDFITVTEKVKSPLGTGDIDTQVPKPFLFLRQHIDPTDPFKIPWPAKTRASKAHWNEVPPIMAPDMVKFYTFMDGLLQKERDAREAKKQATSVEK
jgi:hypothetical protein